MAKVPHEMLPMILLYVCTVFKKPQEVQGPKCMPHFYLLVTIETKSIVIE